jgi:glutathione S-transferase
MLELHHDWDAFCCIKVRFCLAEKGVRGRAGRRSAADGAAAPGIPGAQSQRVVPVLVHEGRVLTESSFINEYVDEVFEGPARAAAIPWSATPCGSGSSSRTTFSTRR